MMISDVFKIDEDHLCDYCEADPMVNYGTPGGTPYFCEGRWCNEAEQTAEDDILDEYFQFGRKGVMKCKIM
jgi:hypothetical protein